MSQPQQQPQPLDYPAMPIRELRARFAVRALGWRWFIGVDSAHLLPPADVECFREAPVLDGHFIEDSWPDIRKRFTHELHPHNPGAGTGAFHAAEYPHPDAWHNVGRVLEAMRKRGFVDLNAYNIGFDCIVHIRETIEILHGDPDPERAALIAALRALDAEADNNGGDNA